MCTAGNLIEFVDSWFSAGCGRTGTLISLYSIIEAIQFQFEDRASQTLHKGGQDQRETYPDAFYLEHLQSSPIPSSDEAAALNLNADDGMENRGECTGRSQERISIFSAVRRVREQRWNLVKNVEQYKYLYKFVGQWIQAHQQQVHQAQ